MSLGQSEKENILDYLYEKSLNYGHLTHFYNFLPERDLSFDKCKEISQYLNRPSITSLKKWVDKILTKVENNPKEYASVLEALIRFLSSLPEDDYIKCKFYLADLCYQRAIILKPKGTGKFPKKENLLNQALHYLDNINNDKACILKAQIYLELEEMGIIKEDFKEVLKHAVILPQLPDLWILLRCFFEDIDRERIAPKLELLFNSNDNLIKSGYFLIKKNEEKAIKEFYKFLERYFPTSFSESTWQKALFICNKFSSSKKLELLKALWEKLREFENSKAFHNIHLLYYWSKTLDIYKALINEALFQKECKLLAKVIDGLKARALVQWDILEKHKDFENIIESERLARLGQYVSKKIKIANKKIPNNNISNKQRLKNYTALLHLYFDENQKNAQAILEKPDNTASFYEFNIMNLQKIFKEYSSAYYYSTNKENAINALLPELLEALGNEFKFLFEIEDNLDKLIIIPYGFLHLLPIHGAWNNKNDEYLFEKFAVGYLPAKYFIKPGKTKHSLNSKDSLYIQEFSEYDFQDLKNLLIKNYQDIEIIDKAPQLKILENRNLKDLFFVSHGKSNFINPFENYLKIPFEKNKEQTYFYELLKLKISAERVFIIGCETDLDYYLENVVEEYLSLSTLFLSKGVKSVLGTLWEIDPSFAEEVIMEIILDNDIVIAFNKYLKKELSGNAPIDNYQALATYLPFKIYDTNIMESK